MKRRAAVRAFATMVTKVLVGALLCGAAARHAAADDDVPRFEAVRDAHRPSDLTVLDRHGEPIQSLRIDDRVRRLPWLPLARVSPALRELLVQGEDRRFWSHDGVDWGGLARGALARVQGRVQGGSTLTMQLAALLDPTLARPAGGRGVARKWSQIGAAKALEARWSKAQILEAYLNLVPLRGELVGAPAASWQLFGKHASGLDRSEAALLVALLRAPNAAPVLVQRRACALIGEAPDCERIGIVAARALAPGRAMPPLVEPLAPHHARWLFAQQRPPLTATTLRSTLDARLQRAALLALRAQMAELQGRQVEDGAIVVLNNRTGEVLAWVGSSGAAWSDAPAVDAVLARRQPGSTLKPFVYALAFQRGLLTPASLVHDAPADLDGGSGAFMPRNYDHRYRGWVSARTALAASLNVPAARVAALLGPEPLFDALNAAGLQLSESGGYHGLALALGTADVTLLQLTNAYRMLANLGRWSPVVATPGPSSAGGSASPAGTAAAKDRARSVIDARSAFQIGDILADAGARATSFGLDSALVTRGFAAVKTGTSKDMRDNWCIGYTDQVTVGVWIGNASGAAMQRVSGTQGAAPVWRTLVQQLQARAPSRAPAPPAGLERREIRFDAALEPSRDEWFVAGSAPAEGRVRIGEQLALARPSGITSPRDGSLFALDPDMPAPVQRIRFEGEPGQWWLDGQPLGRGASLQWMPWPGRHRLELRNSGGRVIDRVSFEVREATVARP